MGAPRALALSMATSSAFLNTGRVAGVATMGLVACAASPAKVTRVPDTKASRLSMTSGKNRSRELAAVPYLANSVPNALNRPLSVASDKSNSNLTSMPASLSPMAMVAFMDRIAAREHKGVIVNGAFVLLAGEYGPRVQAACMITSFHFEYTSIIAQVKTSLHEH